LTAVATATAAATASMTLSQVLGEVLADIRQHAAVWSTTNMRKAAQAYEAVAAEMAVATGVPVAVGKILDRMSLGASSNERLQLGKYLSDARRLLRAFPEGTEVPKNLSAAKATAEWKGAAARPPGPAGRAPQGPASATSAALTALEAAVLRAEGATLGPDHRRVVSELAERLRRLAQA